AEVAEALGEEAGERDGDRSRTAVRRDQHIDGRCHQRSSLSAPGPEGQLEAGSRAESREGITPRAAGVAVSVKSPRPPRRAYALSMAVARRCSGHESRGATNSASATSRPSPESTNTVLIPATATSALPASGPRNIAPIVTA